MSKLNLVKLNNSLLYVNNKSGGFSFFERVDLKIGLSSVFNISKTLDNNSKHKIYKKRIGLNGLGYKAFVEGKKLHFKLNLSHVLAIDIPSYIKKITTTKTSISFESTDLILLGNYLEYIYNFRQKDSYKSKGFSLRTKVVVKKEVKKKK